MAESQARTDASLKNLSDAQAQTEGSLKTLSARMAASQARTDASLKNLSDAQAQTEGSLKTLSARMAASQARTDASLKNLSEEMQKFRDDMKASRNEMNEKWGEMVNKLGTLVEDIVAPNIPRIARAILGWSDIEDFMVRRKVRNKRERSKRQEFDVIAVGEEQIIINETKSRPEVEDVDEFIELLGEVKDYFPEYTDKTIIPIFASLYMDESLVKYLTRRKIYAMMMGEETMGIVNFQQVNESGTTH